MALSAEKVWFEMIKEFKEFIARGNVIDLAIGIIIGAAFTAIVKSLVDDIIMPLIALITAGVDFSSWKIPLAGGGAIGIGAFIAAVINFLLVALVLFFIVKAMNRFRRKKEETPPKAPRLCPFCKSEIADDATRCPHCTSELAGK